MRALLSIKLWIAFIAKLLKVLFPTMIVAAVFAVIGRKKIIKNAALHLLIAFGLVNLAGRLFILFAGVSYQERYLYIIVTVLLVFCGLGIVEFSAFLEKLIQRIVPENRFITSKNIFIFTVALILIINSAKGLRARLGKTWIRNIPQTILDHTPKGKRPILITGFDEFRIGFYADANFIRLNKPDNLLYHAKFLFNGKEISDSEFRKCLDGSLTTKKQLSNDGRLTIKISKKCRYRTVYLDLFQKSTPQGTVSIKVKKENQQNWEEKYHGKIKDCIKLFKVKTMTEMLLQFDCAEPIQFNKLYLSRYQLWNMREKGSGFSCEEWLPIFKNANIAQLNHNLNELGGKNVFLLMKGSPADWQPIFEADNVDLTVIKEFKKVKKNKYTLFQLNPSH